MVSIETLRCSRSHRNSSQNRCIHSALTIATCSSHVSSRAFSFQYPIGQRLSPCPHQVKKNAAGRHHNVNAEPALLLHNSMLSPPPIRCPRTLPGCPDHAISPRDASHLPSPACTPRPLLYTL